MANTTDLFKVELYVSPQTLVPGIKESPHFCRDSDYISDYCTLKI